VFILSADKLASAIALLITASLEAVETLPIVSRDSTNSFT